MVLSMVLYQQCLAHCGSSVKSKDLKNCPKSEYILWMLKKIVSVGISSSDGGLSMLLTFPLRLDGQIK